MKNQQIINFCSKNINIGFEGPAFFLINKYINININNKKNNKLIKIYY